MTSLTRYYSILFLSQYSFFYASLITRMQVNTNGGIKRGPILTESLPMVLDPMESVNKKVFNRNYCFYYALHHENWIPVKCSPFHLATDTSYHLFHCSLCFLHARLAALVFAYRSLVTKSNGSNGLIKRPLRRRRSQMVTANLLILSESCFW